MFSPTAVTMRLLAPEYGLALMRKSPTTLLIDPAGCEIGTVAGPAEWASSDGIKLVSAALGNVMTR